MLDFNNINLTTKDERIRAWCVEKAVGTFSLNGRQISENDIVRRADVIQKYVTNGSSE